MADYQDIGFEVVGKKTISSNCVKVTIRRIESTLDNDAQNNELPIILHTLANSRFAKPSASGRGFPYKFPIKFG
ncbi:MAG: hypothetical protein J5957_08560 [Prevotella sp.]|nr:hypothetical protein [Prevotella sp.]